MSQLRVYLSGGFHSGWQYTVIEAVDQHVEVEWYNPLTHGLTRPQDYTIWDLEHIRLCDVVFAYMEASSPCGLGVALEVGYARGMGKPVILVDKKSGTDTAFFRYFALTKFTASQVVYDLDQGIEMLCGLAKGMAQG